MEKIKVFIDTNIINNPSPVGRLFGSVEKLKCLEGVADIIIPQIVKDELIEHKRRAFLAQKKQLAGNELLSLIVADASVVDGLEFCESCVLPDEALRFSIEDVHDKEKCFQRIQELAIRGEAPFEKKSDKGMKDAIIAFTIDEYLERNPGVHKPVIFVSNDGRLGEYFQGRDDVAWVRNIDELRGRLEEMSAATEIGDQVDEERRQANTRPLTEARKLLSEWRNSGSFAMTHDTITKLKPYLKYLTREDKVDILLSALDNEQIMWIIGDSDVREFIKPIFDECNDSLSIQQYNDFISRAAWSEYRAKEPVPVSELVLK